MKLRSNKLTTGKILKSFRNRFGLSQKEVSSVIEISVPYLSVLENDKRKVGTDLAGRFAVIYGIRLERLLFSNGLKDIKGYKKLLNIKTKLEKLD